MGTLQDQGGLTGAKVLSVGDVVVGRYKIDREIGRGGYAIVYRAIDQRTDEAVALKTIRPVAPRPEEVVARFRREVDLISRLRHRNTVRVFDYGFEDDLYLVMELLEGSPLSDILDGVNGLDPNRAVEIIRGVLESLTEAHGLGIVHRDLKPENIFILKNEDGSESVKVLDFGIAKVTGMSEEELAQQDLTLQGRAMGTPTYMSPEQARGASLTIRSDIYAVSILLYEMLCGVPPFQGEGAMEIMLKHVNDPPPSLCLPHWRGSPLERALLKGLSKEPNHRFRSAYDYLNALDLPFDELFAGTHAPSGVGEEHETLPLAELPRLDEFGLSGASSQTSDFVRADADHDDLEPPEEHEEPFIFFPPEEELSPLDLGDAQPPYSEPELAGVGTDTAPQESTPLSQESRARLHPTNSQTPILQGALATQEKKRSPVPLLLISGAVILLSALALLRLLG